MLRSIRNRLSPGRIESIETDVIEAASSGDSERAWNAIKPLLGAQKRHKQAATCLLRLVAGRHFPVDRAVDILAEVHAAHPDDDEMLVLLGDALEAARDIDDLNAAPPDHPLFHGVVDRLAHLAPTAADPDRLKAILRGLSTGSRMMARQRDELAEQSYKRLVELDPDRSSGHYNLGLFYKTRGRFREGMLANQEAVRLADEPVEAYEWNLGICATGAGEAGIALAVWKGMGQKIEMGRFGLPDGGYPQCKVRLAERPLAERTADDDDPGLEETIWIQRLSPCHGIIRSVLYQHLGVDYGDVVLFDGAPITHHKYGDTDVPVFPHLATLVRNHYQFYDFAGTQDASGRIADASRDLHRDAIVYAHSENFLILCSRCWRDPDLDHEDHAGEEKHVVHGRIAAPPDIPAGELLKQLDQALQSREPCRIYSPDLCEAAGSAERARFEQRRFELLRSA